MTRPNTQKAWEQFLSFAKTRCSTTAFGNWLQPIEVAQVTEEEITLKVPNIFVKEYLLSNYKEDLCSFLPVKRPGEPAIRFLIEAPKPKAPAATTAAPAIATAPSQVSCRTEIHLNPGYTFQSLVNGPNITFAKTAAQGVAERPGLSYNPLFIHGGVGLGKTHLLHAIGQHIRSTKKNLRVQCITTEQFINDLVDSLRSKSVDKMKRFYRQDVDVLLVDDIQFLQNRTNFEEEFCNMFEALINQNKQIVITSDKAPGNLKLSERMIARMEWGLVAQVSAPDLETRVAILQHKAEMKGVKIPQNVAFYIAENIYNNVRQLEGAINRLSAQSRLLDSEITLDLVESALSELFQKHPMRRITVEEIIDAVATVFQIKLSAIKGSGRTQDVALARQVAMYLAMTLIKNESVTSLSHPFGRTHSTLIHAHNKIKEQLSENELLRRQVQMIRRNIEAA